MPAEMRNDTALMDRIHAYLPGWDIPKMSAALFTNHFGLVSDFLSECFTRLRSQSRAAVLRERVSFGGALSGRDAGAVQKTVSGLLKLLNASPEAFVSDKDLEWAVRLALECRRRVKEQQKRIGAAEFRNTHFSYHLGSEGVEKFVVTPELQSEDQIGDDPLPPGQIWTISPGGPDEHPGLYRIEVNEGPGSGVKLLNRPAPQAFVESLGCGEQNLYARARELVGDRDPREHEFTVQLRAFDTAKSGSQLGLGALLALCSALLQKSIRGGLIVIGGLNLGGSLNPLPNAVSLVERAVEKGAGLVLMPVSARRQLFDLSDEMATKIDVQFYSDAREALLKALAD
jgi:ATP-dependent Lon protease